MKGRLFFIILVFPLVTSGQISKTQLDSVNLRKSVMVQNGMKVLGGWGLLNIIGSSFDLAAGSRLSGEKSFHISNIAWNSVNFALSIPYVFMNKPPVAGPTGNSLKQHGASEKLFLYMSGLDLFYIASGFYLHELSFRTNHMNTINGVGISFIYNGLFLLGFDTFMYLTLHKENKRFYNQLNRLTIFPTPGGLGLIYRL